MVIIFHILNNIQSNQIKATCLAQLTGHHHYATGQNSKAQKHHRYRQNYDILNWWCCVWTSACTACWRIIFSQAVLQSMQLILTASQHPGHTQVIVHTTEKLMYRKSPVIRIEATVCGDYYCVCGFGVRFYFLFTLFPYHML